MFVYYLHRCGELLPFNLRNLDGDGLVGVWDWGDEVQDEARRSYSSGQEWRAERCSYMISNQPMAIEQPSVRTR